MDLTPNAQELLAFITPQGSVFKWKVMPFGALRPHVPLAWSGQRIVLVPYTGIAWGRLPVAMQNELVTFGFPR